MIDRTLPRLYTNQFRTPLFAGDVAQLIHRLYSRSAPYGMYHAGGPDRLSRYDMGVSIADCMRIHPDAITPGYLERDKSIGNIDDTSLNTEKAQGAADMTFTSFADGMRKLAKVLYYSRLRSL